MGICIDWTVEYKEGGSARGLEMVVTLALETSSALQDRIAGTS